MQPERPDILIVEDNQVNLLILRAMLRKRGHMPVEATDGAEGVALAERLRPRLVLMDLQMPKLDGLSAAAEIVRRLGPDAPALVAVTANVGADIQAQCEAAGFVDVLTKPIMYEQLVEIVDRRLRLS
jgi:CheY-like chemotaxis protein